MNPLSSHYKGAYKLRKSYQLLHKLFDMIVLVESTTCSDPNEGTTQVVSCQENHRKTAKMTSLMQQMISQIQWYAAESRNRSSMNIPNKNKSIRIDPFNCSNHRSHQAFFISHYPQNHRILLLSTVGPPLLQYQLYTIYLVLHPDMTITDQSIYAGTLMALGSHYASCISSTAFSLNPLEYHWLPWISITSIINVVESIF